MASFASSKPSIGASDELNDTRLREDASVPVDIQGPVRFSVWVSFMEIYNDQIFDLFDPPPKKKNARRTVLQLKEDKNGVPYVRGTLALLLILVTWQVTLRWLVFIL